MAKLTTHKARYWDFRAFFYALYYKLPILSLLSHFEHKSLVDLWNSTQKKPAGVHLDIACGAKPVRLPGNVSCSIGLDNAFEMLRFARQAQEGRPFVRADALFPPFKSSTIAVITAAGLTEYLPEPVIFCRKMEETLTEDGILIFTFSHHNLFNNLRKLYNPPMYLRSRKEWEGISTKYGFKIIRSKRLLLQTHILCIKSKN